MNGIAIEIINISKDYVGVKALQGVSFAIKRGCIHGLIGGNGAGKSTLIKILSGAILASEGEIKVNGTIVRFKNPADAKYAGISTIYQELNVAPDLDVKSNLFLGNEITKSFILTDKRKMYSETEKILKILDINISPDAIMHSLSVAEIKLVEIAKAIYQNSSILIMDEPTASISDHEISILHKFILDLKEKGHTVIYISHKINEIFKICDDVTILRDGKHVLTTQISELDYKKLAYAMINKEDFSYEYPKRDGQPTKNVVLEVKNLCYKNYVKNVSLKVNKGEILGIAGMIGSGRSELMKTIIGEYKAESGEVFLNSQKVRINKFKEAFNLGIAYLPEDRKREGLFLDQEFGINVTICNLNEVFKWQLMNKTKIIATCKLLIDKLRISVVNHKQIVDTLSGGNQQKSVIAKWLNTNADLFIFDEPTVGVDIGAKFEIRNLINKLADNGKSIIIISSELEEVCNMSNRVIVIRNGTVVAEFENEKIQKNEVYSYASGVK